VMKKRRINTSDDGGSALIEFTFLALLLLVPLIYVVLSVFEVQRAAYGVTSAVREAGRAYVDAGSTAEAERAAQAAAAVSLADQGLQLGPGQLTTSCSANPCLSPGAKVTFRLGVRVALPFVPEFLGRNVATVGVSARHDAVVEQFRAVRQ
jgi:Flp pilus assembly protein TadG